MACKLVVGASDYVVSDIGQVFSLRGRYGRPVVEVAPQLASGYLRVNIVHDDGQRKHRLVNRMVCEAFHGAPPNDSAETRHLNGNPHDNRAINLSWGTAHDNAHDRLIHGGTFRGMVARAKLSCGDILEIRRRFDLGEHPLQIAKSYDVGKEHVRKIGKRLSWRHLA